MVKLRRLCIWTIRFEFRSYMHWAFIVALVVCTIEGVIGIILNVWLLYSLLRSKRSLMESIYRVPIYVSAVLNLTLCLLIATMNFVHIFRDGTFVSCMFGPLTHVVPTVLPVVAFEVALVLTTLMWSLIPVTATLQFIGLSRISLSYWKRITISFAFTILCVIDVSFFAPGFVPTREFNVVLEDIARDLYGLEKNFYVVAVGGTANYVELNNGRNLITLMLYLILATYILSYVYFVTLVVLIRRCLSATGVTLSERTLRLQRAFHRMQLLQGFLPLVILSIPALIFVIGALLHSNLDFVTLVLTFFLWICPSVQALVQLRFVKQSISRSPDPTRTGASIRRGSERYSDRH